MFVLVVCLYEVVYGRLMDGLYLACIYYVLYIITKRCLSALKGIIVFLIGSTKQIRRFHDIQFVCCCILLQFIVGDEKIYS